jgi:hypothetical protein
MTLTDARREAVRADVRRQLAQLPPPDPAVTAAVARLLFIGRMRRLATPEHPSNGSRHP